MPRPSVGQKSCGAAFGEHAMEFLYLSDAKLEEFLFAKGKGLTRRAVETEVSALGAGNAGGPG